MSALPLIPATEARLVLAYPVLCAAAPQLCALAWASLRADRGITAPLAPANAIPEPKDAA